MPNSPLRNRILNSLPKQVREQVLDHCRPVELPSGHVIYDAGATVEHAYFIDGGLVSLLKSMNDGSSVEIGAVGVEGFVGLFAAHGFDRAIVDYVVQVPAKAWRIQRNTLRHEMLRHEILRGLIERYLFLLVDQIAQSAACNRLHSLEQRCCRWLLFAHDNAFANRFSLTHEFLASLLGVQRPSVSMTANGLQKRGFIDYTHGRITILDRPALEKNACECYQTIRKQIALIFD